MDDIGDQHAFHDAVRRKLYARMTPQERLNRFYALQARAAATLMSSPGGFERFWRRNARRRAVAPHDHAPAGK